MLGLVSQSTLDAIIENAASYWSVPEEWIRAVIQVESNWDVEAYNPEGSYGLMQIYEPTARAYGIPGPDFTILFDPQVNIEVGTHLLSDLRQRFGDDFRAVYSAYNSGSATAWQTSAEVADHVAKALVALAEVVSEQVPGGGVGMILVGVVLLVGIRKKWGRL